MNGMRSIRPHTIIFLDVYSFEYTMVDADSGNIGGSKSNEFHVIANTGEDDLLIDEKGLVLILK